MRAISGALATRLIATATAPGYLVELGFSTTQRWSTRGTITWNSLSWTGIDFSATYQPGSKGAQSDRATISLNNHDNTIGTLLLSSNFSGLTCKLYFFDGDAPASDEVTQIFEGVGDVFTLTPFKATMSFASKGQDILKLPYTRIARNSIRDEITPPGTVVFWNGERYEITN